MVQVKISVTDEQHAFLERHRRLGFRDRSAMVREALERLRAERELCELHESAALYADTYEHDEELRELTAAAAKEWPA